MDDDGGHMCVYQKVKAGIPFVSDRSMIVSYYRKDDGDNHLFMVSGRGNEHLLEAHKAKIGDDVIATMEINYMHFSPKFDSCGDLCGTEIKQIVKTNPNGSLINAAKSKMIAFQSTVLPNVVKYMRSL